MYPQGRMSHHFIEMKEGDYMAVKGPKGWFKYRPGDVLIHLLHEMNLMVKYVFLVLQVYAFIGSSLVLQESSASSHDGNKFLVVPVIRDAEKMNFADIEKKINTLAKKANSGSLFVDEMAGGSFTISNGGVSGNLLSTPIINPP